MLNLIKKRASFQWTSVAEETMTVHRLWLGGVEMGRVEEDGLGFIDYINLPVLRGHVNRGPARETLAEAQGNLEESVYIWIRNAGLAVGLKIDIDAELGSNMK